MSQLQHMTSLPTPKDVEALLKAASDAAAYQYRGMGYSYIRKALCKLFSTSIEYLKLDADPVEILLETVQDELAILNRHNRLQAKALSRGYAIYDLSEELINFPFRYLAIEQGVKLPPDLAPIYQLTNDHNYGKVEAARAAAQSHTSSPPPTESTPSEQIVMVQTRTMGKLLDAPSPEHDFPNANITIAEIATFLPQSIKSWDVGDRILWNNAATEDIANLINKHRTMPVGTIENNSVFLMMRGQMRKRTQQEHGYRRWSTWIVGAQANVQKPGTFDPDSISVNGFRRPQIFHNRPYVAADPIPFRHLANGVSVWPEGGDALDLTRMVSWCVDNPDQEYHYPTDYQEVLTLVGGPATAQERHTDAAVLARLRSGPAIQPRRTPTSQNNDDIESDEEGATRSGKRKHRTSPEGRLDKRTKTTVTGTPRKTRAMRKSATRTGARRPIFDVDSEEGTDDEAFQGPKRVTKNKDAPRRSGRNKTVISYTDDTTQLDDYESIEVDEEQKEEDEGYGVAEDKEDIDDLDADEMKEDEY